MGPKLNILNQWISSLCWDEEIDNDLPEIGRWNCDFVSGRKLGLKLENESVIIRLKVEEMSCGSGHKGKRVTG